MDFQLLKKCHVVTCHKNDVIRTHSVCVLIQTYAYLTNRNVFEDASPCVSTVQVGFCLIKVNFLKKICTSNTLKDYGLCGEFRAIFGC